MLKLYLKMKRTLINNEYALSIDKKYQIIRC